MQKSPSKPNNNPEETQIFIADNDKNKQKKSTGLNKDEVQEAGEKKKFSTLRWICIILIALVVIACIIAIILLLIYYPRCGARPNLQFWQKDVLYQVEVSNFKDTNADGIGDVNGLISELDYLKKMGANTLAIARLVSKDTPKTPDAEYADEESLKNLKKELDSRDMNLVIDLPANYLTKNGKDTIEHWLRNYADGIRVTNANDAISSRSGAEDTFKKDLEEWNELAETISKDAKEHRFVTVYPANKKAENGLVPDERFLNFNSENIGDQAKVVSEIADIYKDLGKDQWPGLVLGDYDSKRLKNGFPNSELSKIVHGIALLLKGTPITLFGDEIELTGRNEIENIMKWNDGLGCGFTDKRDVGEHFESLTNNCENNVKSLMSNEAGPDTLFRLYNNLTKLRQEPSLLWGDVLTSEKDNSNIISFVRKANGFDSYLIIANTGDKSDAINFKDKHDIIEQGTVAYYYSVNPNDNETFKVGQEIKTNNIQVKNGQLLVVKLPK